MHRPSPANSRKTDDDYTHIQSFYTTTKSSGPSNSTTKNHLLIQLLPSQALPKGYFKSSINQLQSCNNSGVRPVAHGPHRHKRVDSEPQQQAAKQIRVVLKVASPLKLKRQTYLRDKGVKPVPHLDPSLLVLLLHVGDQAHEPRRVVRRLNSPDVQQRRYVGHQRLQITSENSP